jgi:hypothetical protein
MTIARYFTFVDHCDAESVLHLHMYSHRFLQLTYALGEKYTSVTETPYHCSETPCTPKTGSDNNALPSNLL